MKSNKIITAVVLVLSFFVFDGVKESIVERIASPKTDHEILIGSVEKLQEVFAENLTRAKIVVREEECERKGNRLISTDLGKKVCKAIFSSEF